jgi:hypothetical protein
LMAIEPVILVEPAKASPGESFIDAQSLNRLFWPEALPPRISQAQFERLTRTLLMWLPESNPNPEKRIEINFATLSLRRKRPDRYRADDLYCITITLYWPTGSGECLNSLQFSYSFIS